jgi:hypothetical protein
MLDVSVYVKLKMRIGKDFVPLLVRSALDKLWGNGEEPARGCARSAWWGCRRPRSGREYDPPGTLGRCPKRRAGRRAGSGEIAHEGAAERNCQESRGGQVGKKEVRKDVSEKDSKALPGFIGFGHPIRSQFQLVCISCGNVPGVAAGRPQSSGSASTTRLRSGSAVLGWSSFPRRSLSCIPTAGITYGNVIDWDLRD